MEKEIHGKRNTWKKKYMEKEIHGKRNTSVGVNSVSFIGIN
ncbi:hypothetical protein EhV164_00336 [Emiliania huxleyi virus 164]|nr:hypothetical protein EhV164_00336 [Emiliania huxleyi virus 164]